ncbi:unnamed protein product [marine sediment metagenome]|uniref:Holin-like toxin n=1 Tax=marine sediment metagenome TaxID=412755 RepID=X1AQX3_9ZZZZ
MFNKGSCRKSLFYPREFKEGEVMDMTAFELAFDATVITMIVLGILAMLISRIKERRKDD